MNLALAAAHGNILSAMRELRGEKHVRMSTQPAHLRAGVHVPELGRPVGGHGGDHASIRAERHAIDLARMTGDLAKLLARAHVPDADGMLVVDEEQLSIVREGVEEYPSLLSRQ